ncbi:hypothetical protein RJ641_026748 [Dillenia turbinata]|uniref:Uncharacterized protein n=1 Tax=Dillenia turbinata TaxID=194707 RepID=A0AAN8ZKN4_9MAGN
MAPRILLCGDVLGRLNQLFKRRSSIPLPTYFIGDYGTGAPKVLSAASKDSTNLGFKMVGLKICENFFWLRGSGKFSLHGLFVVYLSGKQPPGPPYGTYSQDDVDALRALMGESEIIGLFLTYLYAWLSTC